MSAFPVGFAGSQVSTVPDLDVDNLPRVGIITALPIEAATLGASTRIPSIQSLNATTLLATSGVGATQAREAALKLAELGVRGILSFGTAAGLGPQMMAGDLVLPREVRTQTPGDSFKVTPQWHDALKGQVSLSRTEEPMLELSKVVTSPEEKSEIFQRYQCVAGDMESVAVARVCADEGLAFAVVRVVSDGATTAIPSCVLNSFDGVGNLSLPRLILNLLAHPWQLVSLIKLGGAFAKTKKTLTATFSELKPDLGLPETGL